MTSGDLPALPPDALDAARTLARARHLLVATDFDGTMAPLVADPSKARALPASARALVDLARLADTTAAVISGRSLAVLRALTDFGDDVRLVGSHGVEFDETFAQNLAPDARVRLANVNTRADALVARYPGMAIEKKPASTALHYRHVAPESMRAVIDAITSGPCAVDGVHVTGGKYVVEIAAIATGKGNAVDQLRRLEDISAVVFIGDDVTDEDAFGRLTAADIGIKVGDGPTAATVRVPSTETVAAFLATLAIERRHYLDRKPSR